MSKNNQTEKTERELLKEISSRLNTVIGLLAVQGKSEDDQIEILSSLGFDSKTTGLFLGLTAEAVRGRRFKKKHRKQ